MNPTSNKKDLEDLSTNIKDLAYNYVEKYAPSKQQLKIYLLKKYITKFKGSSSKKEFSQMIDEIIVSMVENKFLNDEFYSDSKARIYLRRGYSLNKISLALKAKGIDREFIKKSLEKIKADNIDTDFVSALKLCQKKRIGAIRHENNRELFYKKDMGVLARAGFSYEISKKVLSLRQAEYLKLIKIV